MCVFTTKRATLKGVNDMLIKLLEAIESHIIESGACGDVKRILNACGETLNCAEYRDCEECEAHSLGFIAKLKEQVSEQSCKNGWIPIEKRLPQEYEFVLIQNTYGVMSVAQRLGDGWFNFQGTELNKAVAWMPLPTPYHAKEK